MLNISDYQVIVCENPERTQRVTLNVAQRTITFENCHLSRSFFSVGFDKEQTCSLDDIIAVQDFLRGQHRGTLLRALGFLGGIGGIGLDMSQYASLMISTRQGRVRVFADWTGINELQSALKQVCPNVGSASFWKDDMRLAPLFAIALVGLVVAILWFLL